MITLAFCRCLGTQRAILHSLRSAYMPTTWVAASGHQSTWQSGGEEIVTRLTRWLGRQRVPVRVGKAWRGRVGGVIVD